MTDQGTITPETEWPTPIEIGLPWSHIKKTFVTVGELQNWATNERTNWDAILNQTPVQANIRFSSEVGSHLSARTKQLQAQSTRPLTRQLIELEGQQQKIVTALRDIEDPEKYIDTASNVYRAFAEAIEKNPERLPSVPSAIADLLKLKISPEPTADLRHILDGHAWANELRGGSTVDSSDESVAEEINRWNAKLSGVRDAYSNAVELLSHATEVAHTIRDEELGKWAEFEDAARKSIASLDDTFREKIHLKAAVEYWKGKATEHLWWFSGHLVLFGAAAAGLIYSSFAIFPDLIKNRIASTHQIIVDNTITSSFEIAIINLSVLAIASLPIILAIWILRFFMRQAVQHGRLREDATMRSKMVHVYLALIADVGDVAKTKDWKQDIILDAIFRPVAVHTEDDGLPNILAAVKSTKYKS